MDEPVRAFRFKNANGAFRVQLTKGTGSPEPAIRGGRTWLAARKENLMEPAAERRACDSSVVFDGYFPPFGWDTYDDWEWLNTPYYVPGDPNVPNSS